MDENNDDDIEMTFVPPEEREAVRNCEDESEAELAAGYLRSAGIACEVGKMMIPGLPYELALWVRRKNAVEAKELLEAADQGAKGPRAVEE